MSWNYRVVRHAAPNGETYYGLHEVYYDQHGKIELWCETPEGTADTLAGLAAALRLQLEAQWYEEESAMMPKTFGEWCGGAVSMFGVMIGIDRPGIRPEMTCPTRGSDAGERGEGMKRIYLQRTKELSEKFLRAVDALLSDSEADLTWGGPKQGDVQRLGTDLQRLIEQLKRS